MHGTKVRNGQFINLVIDWISLLPVLLKKKHSFMKINLNKVSNKNDKLKPMFHNFLVCFNVQIPLLST